MDIRDLAITSLETITVFDIETGDYLFTLDELQNATINQGQEKVDITGKQGRKITSLKRNKTVTVSGTNGLVSTGLLGLQVGSKFENGSYEVLWTDEIKATEAGKAETSYVAIGDAGAEIIDLYIKKEDGTLGELLTQSPDTADGSSFTYDPASKALVFDETKVPAGTELTVYYKRMIAEAMQLENLSDKYSGKAKIYIDAMAEDKCANVYHIQYCIPKGDFSGEFEMGMGDDQTVHAFEVEALAGGCGDSNGFFTLTIIGKDAEDA